MARFLPAHQVALTGLTECHRAKIRQSMVHPNNAAEGWYRPAGEWILSLRCITTQQIQRSDAWGGKSTSPIRYLKHLAREGVIQQRHFGRGCGWTLGDKQLLRMAGELADDLQAQGLKIDPIYV